MKQNKIRIISMLLILVCMMNLWGCQLAKEEAVVVDSSVGVNTVVEDELLGYYITNQSIMSDEGISDEEIKKLLKNKPNGVKDEGLNFIANTKDRIYASKADLTSEEVEGDRIVFDGIKGIPFYYVKIHYKEDYGYDFTIMEADEIVDPGSSINDNDFGIEGTLYINECNDVIYANPIYKTSDGRVYLLPAIGYGASESSRKVTITNSSKSTLTMNGKQESKNTTITLHVKRMDDIKKVLIKQFDKHNQLLSTKKVTKISVPESIKKEKGTAYILCENIGKKVTRQIVDISEESLDVYFMNENGIGKQYMVELK